MEYANNCQGLDFLQTQGKFQTAGFQQGTVLEDFPGGSRSFHLSLVQQDHLVTGIPDEVQVVGSNQLGTGKLTQDPQWP